MRSPPSPCALTSDDHRVVSGLWFGGTAPAAVVFARTGAFTALGGDAQMLASVEIARPDGQGGRGRGKTRAQIALQGRRDNSRINRGRHALMSGMVTLYENPDFTGSSITVDEGDTRFASPEEFNDVASSIQVPAGFCAVLYEHANENGGYGSWVDLLEDCPDLSVYGFDRKASWVRVFRAEKAEGFVWARTSMQDGQVIPGHWERKRARAPQTPPNPVAVVGPPLPPPTMPWPHVNSPVVVRDHRGEGDPPELKVKHVFVLMLENRSFDHLLGFSAITGTDASTGAPTSIDGLTGNESNTYNGATYPVVPSAPDVAPHDPGHSFTAVLEQLCGEGAGYVRGGPYPPIDNSGFVSTYAREHSELPDGAMRCFTPDQVPVLTVLAREFAVCDHWFSSMPGPTEPNRWFVHASTAGNLDESPSTGEYIEWMGLPWGGFEFEKGTIFDRLRKEHVKFRVYAGDSFPSVALLDGVSRTFDIDGYDDFAEDVSSPSYDAAYTFIEPSYDAIFDFKDGSSQHPLGSVAAGERLIKRTYEALRGSPLWESSILVVVYDEHGGFYDHVAPPSARPTGSTGRKTGFTFDQLGPRVPAIVVSPWIPRNLVDHRTYEHSSIISLLLTLFHLGRFTPRSAVSGGLERLLTLRTPRSDAPMTLPDPIGGTRALAAAVPFELRQAERPDEPLTDDPHGTLALALRSAVVQHLEVTPPAEHDAIKAWFGSLTTRADALAYLKDVVAVVERARAKAGIRQSATVRVA